MGHRQVPPPASAQSLDTFCLHVLSHNCPLTLTVALKQTVYLLPADFRSDIKSPLPPAPRLPIHLTVININVLNLPARSLIKKKRKRSIYFDWLVLAAVDIVSFTLVFYLTLIN